MRNFPEHTRGVVFLFALAGLVSGIFVSMFGAVTDGAYFLVPGLIFAVVLLEAAAVARDLGCFTLSAKPSQKFWAATLLTVSYLPTPFIFGIAMESLRQRYGPDASPEALFLVFLFPGLYAAFCVAFALVILVRRWSPFGLGALVLTGFAAGPISIGLMELFGFGVMFPTLFPVCQAMTGAAAGVWFMDPHWHVLPERS